MSFRVFSMIACVWLGLSLHSTDALGQGRKSPSRKSLVHVLVKVNDEQYAVVPGHALDVYRGDQIVFLGALMKPDTKGLGSSAAIDIEEFELPFDQNPAGSRNERGVNIDTAGMPRDSYLVAVRSVVGGELGRIKLVVTEPRFDYAVLQVNGSPVTIRPGGRVQLRPDDQIRLDFVRSNIPDPANVAVEPAPGGGLRFKYRNRVFGQIYLPVNQAR
jgi:hypothetical protein